MEAQLRMREEMKLAEAEREMAVFEEARGAKFSDEVATREEERQAREKREYLKQVMEENKKVGSGLSLLSTSSITYLQYE